MKKRASDAGQDLRTPVLGGTKFPTNDSKQFAKKQFEMSSAEVGPIQPSTKGSKIQDIIPKYPAAKVAAAKKMAPYQQTRKGRRPIRVHNLVKKAGDPMDPITTDPLVRYLKKQAAEGKVEDNLSNMPTGESETELSTECPCPTGDLTGNAKADVSEADKKFDEGRVKPKGKDKDHVFSEGVVNRVLGLR